MKSFVYVVACSAVLGMGPAASAATQAVDGVVAYVNEHVITGSDVEEAVRPVLQQMLSARKGEDLQGKLRKVYDDALNSLIERHLILDAYGKMEQKLPEWAIDERVNEIIQDSFDGERDGLMTALSKGKITFEEWRSQVKDHIIVSVMRGDRVERHTRLSPQAVRAAYDKNKDQYRIPDKVRLRMIVLKNGASADEIAAKRQKADDIVKRLQAGEDFASLAKALSEGSKAEEGGDWGWIEPRMLRPELVRALADLKPSDISGVIETKDELYVLKIEERKNGAAPSFEEAQPQIERDLKQEEAKALYDAWIDALRKNAYVKVLDISSYVNPSPP